MTLEQLNLIAAADGLELNQGEECFWWWGRTEAMKDKIASLYSSSVEVRDFQDFTADQWLESLAAIKKEISQEGEGLT